MQKIRFNSFYRTSQIRFKSDDVKPESMKSLTLENINPNLINVVYGIRGPIFNRAIEIDKDIKAGKKYPFENVIFANQGDAIALGTPPITFVRQVLSACLYPKMLKCMNFPDDVNCRVNSLLSEFKGISLGAYTVSPGVEKIREHVAEYIRDRDCGIPCNTDDIILSNGASSAIRFLLGFLCKDINGKKPGLLTPVPEYPLYSACCQELGITQINYFLNENNNWDLDINELQRGYCEGKDVCNPRALIVINPGNPTGQVLNKSTIEKIVEFAYNEKLLILADEVYQQNMWNENYKFHSFKKVMMTMKQPFCNLELASFISISKGNLCECGLRGGIMELVNFDKKVRQKMDQVLSAQLCSNTVGQVAVDLFAKPPVLGEPSYCLYKKEIEELNTGMKRKAEMLSNIFGSIKGFSINPIQGGLYSFVKVDMPPKAISAAEAKGLDVDTFYALAVLEELGICLVPGSSFSQAPGTNHFRTTILPNEQQFTQGFKKFKEFHENFISKFS